MKTFNDFKYERIDYEKTAAQLGELLDCIEKEKSAEGFLNLFFEIQKVNNHVETMATLCQVRHTVNTKDEFYETENDFWDEHMPMLQVFSSRLSKIALAFKDRAALLKRIPETYFQLAECEVKSFDEKVVPLLQKENKLASEYGKLKASAQIELDGNTYNLASIGALIQSKDRAMRKKAYDAKMNFYKVNQNEFDRIYDQLVQIRTEIAHQLGYQTFTELGYYRMNRLDYNQDMVANYRRQILEGIVPLCTDLHKRQANRLHLDKLAYYDEGYKFESGNPTPKGTADELVQAAVEMYHSMSKETGEFIDVMNEGNLWDLQSRDGKEMGGYCTSIIDEKVPFIFANFNGTSGDVDVLTHEAGHAFQYYCSKDIEVTSTQWPTLESCEIHSMSMEFFAYPYVEKFFREDTDKYYYQHFTGTLEFLPYGVLVDHFQHEIYNHPEMSIADRKATWRKLEKMYMPHANYEGCDILEEGCWWYQQGHIFEAPFYYIDYTLAQVCALQFWARNYSHDPNAFKDYLHLCSLGGTMSFTKLVEEAGLKCPFEDGCLNDVVEKAKKYLETIDDSKL